MKLNFFFPLYAEHLHFLIKRARWIVTKIYAHYTFEQSKFKKRFCYHESGLTSKCKSIFRKRLLQANEQRKLWLLL